MSTRVSVVQSFGTVHLDQVTLKGEGWKGYDYRVDSTVRRPRNLKIESQYLSEI